MTPEELQQLAEKKGEQISLEQAKKVLDYVEEHGGWVNSKIKIDTQFAQMLTVGDQAQALCREWIINNYDEGIKELLDTIATLDEEEGMEMVAHFARVGLMRSYMDWIESEDIEDGAN